MPGGDRLTVTGRRVRRSSRAPAVGGTASTEGSPAQRTCVGCRQRTERSGLLRLVADRSQGVPPPGVVAVVLPDPRSRLPGRGAWVHPDPGCLDAAEKRRAVPRALRVQGAVDLSQVRRHLSAAPPGSPPNAAGPNGSTEQQVPAPPVNGTGLSLMDTR